MNKNINIKYFALFREQAQAGSETVNTSAETVAELYQELSVKYNFSLGAENIRVSINDAYSDMSSPLAENDSVVFIPPVAGG